MAISLSSILLMGNLIPCWGQTDPSVVGQWDFIRPSNPVKWRCNFYDPYGPTLYPNGKDQKSPHGSAFVTPHDCTKVNDPVNNDNDWKSIYGIHTSLLPNGWVIAWGRGKQQTAGNATAYTPCLLWHYADDPNLNQRGDHVYYGYVRYLRDKYPADSELNRQANAFCAAHNLLHDGRLFVTEGNQQATGSQLRGLTTAYTFNASLFNPDQPPFYTNPTDADDPTKEGWRWVVDGNGLPLELLEERWYPYNLTLADGRVIVVGGTRRTGTGNCDDADLKFTSTYEVFNPSNSTFTHYNLYTLACNGSDFQSDDQRPHLGGLYPRLHLISFYDTTQQQVKSRVVYTGPKAPLYVLKPEELPQTTRNDLWTKYTLSGRQYRKASASVLLPALTLNPQNEQQQMLNQVLTIGGFPGSSNCDAYTTTEILDFSSGLPARRDGASMSYGRGHVIAVLLPNGKVFVLGGQSIKDTEEGESEDGCNWDYNSMVLQTELYTPPTSSNDPGSFSALAAADGSDRDADNNCGSTTNKPDLGYRTKDGSRVYHSSAVLLEDGRVLVVGTDAGDPPCLSGCTDTECTHPEAKSLYPAVYTPPYLLKPDGSLRARPQINSVSDTELDYQETFTLNINLASASTSVQSVVLIRPGGSTHSVSFDQRLVNCNFTYSGGDTVTVKAPWNAHIAPPGYYLLFLVDTDGVPSVAKWVHLRVP